MTGYLFWSGLLLTVMWFTRNKPSRLERSDLRYARRHRYD